MFVTIDPYYSLEFYRECKEALRNNGIPFTEHVSIKPPFYWYFKLDDKYRPVMVNYDICDKIDERWLVNAVQPLFANESVLLTRRDNDKGQSSVLKFIENQPMKEARLSDYACFFHMTSRSEVEEYSKHLPGKIWYFGKYYNNRYRLCLCTNKYIEDFVEEGNILLRRNQAEFKEVGKFECELNYNIFHRKDFLIKYTEHPYIENGLTHRRQITPPNLVIP